MGLSVLYNTSVSALEEEPLRKEKKSFTEEPPFFQNLVSILGHECTSFLPFKEILEIREETLLQEKDRPNAQDVITLCQNYSFNLIAIAEQERVKMNALQKIAHSSIFTLCKIILEHIQNLHDFKYPMEADFKIEIFYTILNRLLYAYTLNSSQSPLEVSHLFDLSFCEKFIHGILEEMISLQKILNEQGYSIHISSVYMLTTFIPSQILKKAFKKSQDRVLFASNIITSSIPPTGTVLNDNKEQKNNPPHKVFHSREDLARFLQNHPSFSRLSLLERQLFSLWGAGFSIPEIAIHTNYERCYITKMIPKIAEKLGIFSHAEEEFKIDDFLSQLNISLELIFQSSNSKDINPQVIFQNAEDLVKFLYKNTVIKNSLSKRDKKIFLLYSIGFSLKEISELLKSNTQAILNRLYKIRIQLDIPKQGNSFNMRAFLKRLGVLFRPQSHALSPIEKQNILSFLNLQKLSLPHNDSFSLQKFQTLQDKVEFFTHHPFLESLSKQQINFFVWRCLGLSTDEIAFRSSVHKNTVKATLWTVSRKLKLPSLLDKELNGEKILRNLAFLETKMPSELPEMKVFQSDSEFIEYITLYDHPQLNTLSAFQRKVFALRCVGKTKEEIAVLLKRSTVSSIQSAIQILYKKLDIFPGINTKVDWDSFLRTIGISLKPLENEVQKVFTTSRDFSHFLLTSRYKALKDLSPQLRKILLLKVYGLKNHEISHKLGTSLKTISNQISLLYKNIGTNNILEFLKTLKISLEIPLYEKEIILDSPRGESPLLENESFLIAALSKASDIKHKKL